ncbi:MAG TPA: hypothetical protein VHZ03_57490 [Trebonia sp.]|jgi:hypothetical protein|nr:hypothetical protein [Trebonia sp.]
MVGDARSILVVIWHLLASPEARFGDLSLGWDDRNRKLRARLREPALRFFSQGACQDWLNSGGQFRALRPAAVGPRSPPSSSP